MDREAALRAELERQEAQQGAANAVALSELSQARWPPPHQRQVFELWAVKATHADVYAAMSTPNGQHGVYDALPKLVRCVYLYAGFPPIVMQGR